MIHGFSIQTFLEAFRFCFLLFFFHNIFSIQNGEISIQNGDFSILRSKWPHYFEPQGLDNLRWIHCEMPHEFPCDMDYECYVQCFALLLNALSCRSAHSNQLTALFSAAIPLEICKILDGSSSKIVTFSGKIASYSSIQINSMTFTVVSNHLPVKIATCVCFT